MASPRDPDFGLLLARLARALRSHDRTLHADRRAGGAAARRAEAHAGYRRDAVLAACNAMGVEPLPRAVEDFVRDTFVLPVADPTTNIRIDLIFSTTPFEAAAIGRAIEVEVAGERVPFATAEDLILHKLFAGRPRDLEDAEGIVRRKGPDLDWDYLETWAEEFAVIPGREGMPGAIRRLRSS